jgi:glycine reductase
MKAIAYLNQFFGQVGGEDQADYEPTLHEGTVGAAGLLNSLMPHVDVTHTVICGDNFAASSTDEAVKRILGFLEDKEFDLFFAGPAFMAGRYGNACGAIGKAVKERFGVPVISSMNEENPGVEMYKQALYIFPGGRKATFMKKDLEVMAAFGEKIATGQPLKSASEEGYYVRGIRHEVFLEEPVMAADRAVAMMLKKLKGEPFVSELPIPKMDKVTPAPAIPDLSNMTIALVSSGGIVPSDNPDRIQSASATKWGKYDISKLEVFPVPDYKTIHAGYDPEAADAVPDRVVPLDAMRAYEKEGRFKKLHDYYYVTVGTGTSQCEATRMGQEIAEDLKKAGVDAVILTAT